jgi:hypothetical protein
MTPADRFSIHDADRLIPQAGMAACHKGANVLEHARPVIPCAEARICLVDALVSPDCGVVGVPQKGAAESAIFWHDEAPPVCGLSRAGMCSNRRLRRLCSSDPHLSRERGRSTDSTQLRYATRAGSLCHCPVPGDRRTGRLRKRKTETGDFHGARLPRG